ncbi:MAG: NAD(P)-binding protein [Clostridia bacterium]|nr:NAD(P)-binding protein [Clostridia bacterium]
MSKKIIVAGAGHGGIAAGAILAKNGYDVTVYEKQKRKDMGYDWTDIFDRKGFTAMGMDIPDSSLWSLKNDMTFFGPGMKTALRQKTPEDKLEIQMERKVLYDCLISYAEECGVRFEFGKEIEAPLMLGSRVAGIKIGKKDIFADLVIDACGINSPVRSKLPAHLGIQKDAQKYERFYVWRGFYEKTDCGEVEDKFKVLLFHRGKLGISWVAAEEEYTDILIGRFEKFDDEEVEETLEALRAENPHLGKKLVRGGEFVEIPVRQSLGVLVADGYAAIGDSAFMTVPIIGSGIANSMKAGALLANAVIDDRTDSYSGTTLWKYQKDYYEKIGAGLVPFACIKLLLTRLECDELDYIFEKGILNARDMTAGMVSPNLIEVFKGVTAADIKIKADGLINNTDVLKKVIRLGAEIAAATAVTAAMPKEYNLKKVCAWADKYNDCFKR